MRALVQRVSQASVTVNDSVISEIDSGLLVYLGVESGDGLEDVSYISDKVSQLRIFPDDQDRMNQSVVEAHGSVLVVSAFTLLADARKGRRPTFDRAASSDEAKSLYEKCCDAMIATGLTVQRGRFGAMMQVQSVNAGPVCILLDSKKDY